MERTLIPLIRLQTLKGLLKLKKMKKQPEKILLLEKQIQEQDMEDMDERSAELFPDEEGIYFDNQMIMKNRIRFKFDLQLDSVEAFCSIMQMVVDKVSCLKKDAAFESCELNLFSVPPFGKEKTAHMKISRDRNQVIAESTSPRWDNAFLNTFDKLFDHVN